MTPCTRCGKEFDERSSTVHTCTPSATSALNDLLKRLDGLERFGFIEDGMVRFEQVKTIVGQWVAEQHLPRGGGSYGRG